MGGRGNRKKKQWYPRGVVGGGSNLKSALKKGVASNEKKREKTSSGKK